MTSTRQRIIAVSAVLLLILAVGTFFLIRLGMGVRANGDDPSTTFSDATPHTGDSGSSVADNTGTGSERDNHGSLEDSGPTVADNTRTTNPTTQYPRPAVRIGSVDAISPRSFVEDGLFYAEFYVDDTFSVPVRVIDVHLNQLGNGLLIDPPADESGCRPGGTVEAGKTGYVCTVGVHVSESAEPGYHKGELELVLRATCTSKTGQPCQNLPEHYDPSPDNPIDVTWSSSLAIESDSGSESQPPRPAAELSSVGGIGGRVFKGGGDGYRVQFYVGDAFSVQVRMVEVNLVQPGDELVIDTSASAGGCHPGITVEAGMMADPLCTADVHLSESAELGEHTGELELVFEATCTSKIDRPCQNLPEHYDPSPDNPIDVTWSYYSPVRVAKADAHESPSSEAGPPS